MGALAFIPSRLFDVHIQFLVNGHRPLESRPAIARRRKIEEGFSTPHRIREMEIRIRQRSSFPLGLGVFLAAVLLLVWINFGVLRRQLGFSQPDLTSIPLARNVTADELRLIRSGLNPDQLSEPERLAIQPPSARPLSETEPGAAAKRTIATRDRFVAPTAFESEDSEAQPTHPKPHKTQLPTLTDSTPQAPESQRPVRAAERVNQFHQKFPDYNQILPNSAGGPANQKSLPPTPPHPETGQSIPLSSDSFSSSAENATLTVIENVEEGSRPEVAAASDNAEPAAAASTWNVTEGETWWSICQTHYGDGRLFRALYRENQREFPNYELLPGGSQIRLPPKAQLEELEKRSRQEETVERTEGDRRIVPFYITKSGDTLFDIARRQLGQASRYVDLFELNADRLSPGTGHLTPLSPGLRLVLPAR